jgi:hypothetical protein
VSENEAWETLLVARLTEAYSVNLIPEKHPSTLGFGNVRFAA